MTAWLIRRFIREPSRVEDPDVRAAYGTLAAATGIAVNLLLCAGKSWGCGAGRTPRPTPPTTSPTPPEASSPSLPPAWRESPSIRNPFGHAHGIPRLLARAP